MRIRIDFNADPDLAFLVNANPNLDPDPGKSFQLEKKYLF
jgi:hypothetical protein